MREDKVLRQDAGHVRRRLCKSDQEMVAGCFIHQPIHENLLPFTDHWEDFSKSNRLFCILCCNSSFLLRCFISFSLNSFIFLIRSSISL